MGTILADFTDLLALSSEYEARQQFLAEMHDDLNAAIRPTWEEMAEFGQPK